MENLVRHSLAAQSAHPGLPPDIACEDVHHTLNQILCSRVFSRAKRMSSLLRYLIEQGIAGKPRNTCEFAIGLEVFGRDPASYYPAIDPVVRVQIGRLRERLHNYYRIHRQNTPILVSIPIGSYFPVFKRL